MASPAAVIKSLDLPAGVSVVWSPVNLAYLVLWGSGPVTERQVLRIITDSEELRYYIAELGGGS